MQQVVQPGSSSNGYGRRKTEKDPSTRFDSKFQPGKTNPCRTGYGKGGGVEKPSRDRLIYLTACLIGHQVEVQVLDGSVFSGIFHATNADDFGIVLKTANLVKDGSQGKKNISLSKAPSRTLIIPAKDFVQLTAKGVPVTRDGLSKELRHEIKRELMTDACISRSQHVDLGRELKPWVPDDNDLSRPELENIFVDRGNRGWDQFEANENLFGVKSTFNEELYTTKLDKGPQMRELEREAIRMAREIEGEETFDLHLADERGFQLDSNLEIDEETRFSSVKRRIDDRGYDENEDIFLDSQNEETFGLASEFIIERSLTNASTGKTSHENQASLRSTSGDSQSSLIASGSDTNHAGLEDQNMQFCSEQLQRDSSVINVNRHLDNHYIGCPRDDKEKQKLVDASQLLNDEDSGSLLKHKVDSAEKHGLSPLATTNDPSRTSTIGQEKASTSNVQSESAVPPKSQGTATSFARPSSSAPSISDRGGATSTSVRQVLSPSSTSAGRGLSPSSSVGSLSSEKSTLNPHAKEFKLNPNAKSFVPSLTSLKPPVPDNSFYYPSNMTAVPQMHGIPASIGIGPPFTLPQPVIFNPQATPIPQPYYHPNVPQYGQHMMIGQARPVLYMPTYPPDVPYKGREF